MSMMKVPEVKPYCIYKGKKLYNKKAVQILLGVCERTLDTYVAMGEIHARRVGVGRYSVGFFEEDIDAFLNR